MSDLHNRLRLLEHENQQLRLDYKNANDYKDLVSENKVIKIQLNKLKTTLISERKMTSSESGEVSTRRDISTRRDKSYQSPSNLTYQNSDKKGLNLEQALTPLA
jgi:hypothetical protein